MTSKMNYTVIGAGHGGKAMAGHLALMDFPTTLYNRTWNNVEDIAARGGIELLSRNGGPRGFGELKQVTADMEEAIAEADVIMVVVPATAHADVARAMAPYLKENQIVVLNPGRLGGALEFKHVLRQRDVPENVTIAEASRLIYLAQSEGPANARIFSLYQAVPLAALPASRTSKVLETLAEAYPQFIDGQTVLHTGFNNVETIINPALTILNAGRIQGSEESFHLYASGVTTSVGKLLEALDRERVTVATCLGIRVRTVREWLKIAYDATGDTLTEALHNQARYLDVLAPQTTNHRYINEDVSCGMVPVALLGQRHGVSVRAMDGIIRLACIIGQKDYLKRGRTPEKLGLADMSVGEIKRYVMEGKI